jgi:hypothetical protein
MEIRINLKQDLKEYKSKEFKEFLERKLEGFATRKELLLFVIHNREFFHFTTKDDKNKLK